MLAMKKRNERLERLRSKQQSYIKNLSTLSIGVAKRIIKILDEKGLEQRDLAKLLNKSESEISKWLSGYHNFTFKTIAKIEDALESDLLNVSNSPISPSKIEIIEEHYVYHNFQVKKHTPSCEGTLYQRDQELKINNSITLDWKDSSHLAFVALSISDDMECCQPEAPYEEFINESTTTFKLKQWQD